MYFKKWEELPETMRRDAVRPYYEALEKRKAGIIVKRWIDLILALGLSLVLSPVMLILALCIKLDSRGPVFFRQERVTRYGKLYRIFKFRTMVNDADKKGSRNPEMRGSHGWDGFSENADWTNCRSFLM